MVFKVKRLEDIEREKHEEKRDKLINDVNYVIEGVFKKPKNQNENLFWTIGKIFLFILLFIIIVNIILGNIWLLKFFWNEFF